MRYDFNGKNINIPDNFIETNMKNLDITRAEAVELYLSDEGFITNDEIIAMSAKAKTAGTGAKATGEKPKRKPPERKPDFVKRAMIERIADFLITIENVEGISVPNIERMISFEYEGDKYEVTLTKKRAPKG